MEWQRGRFKTGRTSDGTAALFASQAKVKRRETERRGKDGL